MNTKIIFYPILTNSYKISLKNFISAFKSPFCTKIIAWDKDLGLALFRLLILFKTNRVDTLNLLVVKPFFMEKK